MRIPGSSDHSPLSRLLFTEEDHQVDNEHGYSMLQQKFLGEAV